MKKLRAAANAMAARMKVFRSIAQGARDCRDPIVELRVEEFWEASDEAALAQYEAAVHEANGEVPLPMEA